MVSQSSAITKGNFKFTDTIQILEQDGEKAGGYLFCLNFGLLVEIRKWASFKTKALTQFSEF